MVFAVYPPAPRHSTNNRRGPFSPRKGSILEGGEVRTIVISYAKTHDLVDADNKK